jgi:hypothetical protein
VGSGELARRALPRDRPEGSSREASGVKQ